MAEATALQTSPLRDFNELRRQLVLGYFVGALTSIFSVLAISSDHGNRGLTILAGLEIVVAVFLAVARSLPILVVKLFAFEIAIGAVSAAVALAHPIGPASLYYIWPALTCGHYGTRTDARVALGLLCVTLALALAVAHDPQVPGIMYVSVVSIFALVLAGYQRGHERMVELTEQLARAAATDSLTGLLNRRAFGEAFEREAEPARIAQLPLSLVVFDLDHFKHLNDAFGHAAGDDALCAFADILRERCSGGDLVARMGGEEFAAVLFDTDRAAAQAVVDRIAHALADWSCHAPMNLTTSAGIASLGPGTSTPEEMLLAADRALYAAKEAGRNRVVLFGEPSAHELARAA